MKLRLLFFLLAIATLSLTSCGSVRSSDCGLSKSLKILNIHDTTGPKTLLADTESQISKKDS